MSTASTPNMARSAMIWRIVIIALFVVGVALAVVAPMVTGVLASAWTGCQIILFAILIAAIRSLRRE